MCIQNRESVDAKTGRVRSLNEEKKARVAKIGGKNNKTKGEFGT